jgi:hypothetical protein
MEGKKMDAIVAISRTRKALRRAYFAADDRRDYDEVLRIGQFWNEVDDAERAMPACSARDCQAKLKWAASMLVTSSTGVSETALAARLLHVGAGVVRHGPRLDYLIELRACLATLWDIEPELDSIGVVEHVQPRVEAVIAWLAQPRCVSSRLNSE